MTLLSSCSLNASQRFWNYKTKFLTSILLLQVDLLWQWSCMRRNKNLKMILTCSVSVFIYLFFWYGLQHNFLKHYCFSYFWPYSYLSWNHIIYYTKYRHKEVSQPTNDSRSKMPTCYNGIRNSSNFSGLKFSAIFCVKIWPDVFKGSWSLALLSKLLQNCFYFFESVNLHFIFGSKVKLAQKSIPP